MSNRLLSLKCLFKPVYINNYIMNQINPD